MCGSVMQRGEALGLGAAVLCVCVGGRWAACQSVQVVGGGNMLTAADFVLARSALRAHLHYTLAPIVLA